MTQNKDTTYSFRMTYKMWSWLGQLADDAQMGRAEYLRKLILDKKQEQRNRWRTNNVVRG